jgi:hypothetical protein
LTPQSPRQINVIINWFEELKKLAPDLKQGFADRQSGLQRLPSPG